MKGWKSEGMHQRFFLKGMSNTVGHFKRIKAKGLANKVIALAKNPFTGKIGLFV